MKRIQIIDSQRHIEIPWIFDLILETEDGYLCIYPQSSTVRFFKKSEYPNSELIQEQR
jgi:hypothetical protein